MCCLNTDIVRSLFDHHSCVDSDSSDLRSAGLALLRNIISEGSDEEIDYAFSGLGQSEVLRMVLQGVTASQDRPECAEEVRSPSPDTIYRFTDRDFDRLFGSYSISRLEAKSIEMPS